MQQSLYQMTKNGCQTAVGHQRGYIYTGHIWYCSKLSSSKLYYVKWRREKEKILRFPGYIILQELYEIFFLWSKFFYSAFVGLLA